MMDHTSHADCRNNSFRREGARFVVDHGPLGRFVYDASIEAKSIMVLEEVLFDEFLQEGVYPDDEDDTVYRDGISFKRDDAALALMKFLSSKVIAVCTPSVHQLIALQEKVDALVALMLAEIRPISSGGLAGSDDDGPVASKPPMCPVRPVESA